MEPNENSGLKCYNSTFEHGLDEKRRIQVPAKWRPDEAGTELTLVLWQKAKEGPCLRVLPPAKLKQTMTEIAAMANTDPAKGVLKRLIGSGSAQVTLDKTGRICIPEPMAKAAGINGQAILVGLLDCFEIWNPDRYERVMAADAIMAPEAFRLME
jgi:MraZ protein